MSNVKCGIKKAGTRLSRKVSSNPHALLCTSHFLLNLTLKLLIKIAKLIEIAHAAPCIVWGNLPKYAQKQFFCAYFTEKFP